MFRLNKWIGVAVVVGLTSLAFGTQKANAQSPGFVLPPHQRGLTLRQSAFNIATIGQAFSFVPPYALGFNPYPRVVSSPGISPLASPYAGAAANPYAALYANPYASNAYGTSPGYDNSYNNPYMSSYYDPYSGYLRGGADVINAQGRFMVN